MRANAIDRGSGSNPYPMRGIGEELLGHESRYKMLRGSSVAAKIGGTWAGPLVIAR